MQNHNDFNTTDFDQIANTLLNQYRTEGAPSPAKPNSIMTVGTGGTGLWERNWSRIALDAEQYTNDRAAYQLLSADQTPGVMRAMCFAAGACRQDAITLINYGTRTVRFTDEGQRMREIADQMMADVLARHDAQKASGEASITSKLSSDDRANISRAFEAMSEEQDEQEKVVSVVDDMVARHPDDWSTKFQEWQHFCEIAQELGTHLTMIGFLQQETQLIALGMSVSARSVRVMAESLRDETTADHIPPMPYSQDRGSLANQFAQYCEAVLAVFDIQELEAPEARSFVSETISAFYATTLYKRYRSVPGFREESERLLKYRLDGSYFERLAQAIAKDADSTEIALASIDDRIELVLA